jgi:hypothetical protein
MQISPQEADNLVSIQFRLMPKTLHPAYNPNTDPMAAGCYLEHDPQYLLAFKLSNYPERLQICPIYM